MFFSRTASSTSQPDRSCGGDIIVPLLISIPSMIRLRQCLIEFFRVRRGGHKSEGWGGQHLANALKYSTAFPVIILTAMQRSYDPAKMGMSQSSLYRLWYIPRLTPKAPSLSLLYGLTIRANPPSQDTQRPPKFLLLLLLGHRQRLGPNPLLPHRTQRPKLPLRPPSPPLLLRQGNLLLRHDHRLLPSLHLGLQALRSSGSDQ